MDVPIESSAATTPTRISLVSYWRLLRANRNFRNLWMAQIVSEIGDWFYSLAIYDLLLHLTGRASSVAIALVVQVLPQTLVGPIAGVVNDRIRRKYVMIATDIARIFIVLAMLLVRSQSTVWMVYPLLFIESVMWAFFEPARTAAIPNVVSQDDLILANTLATTTWSVNLFMGATLGGLALAFLGHRATFVVNAISFLVSAIFIAQMRFAEPHTHPSESHTSGWFGGRSFLEGVRYVRNHSPVRALIFIKSGLAMMGVSWVLFTVMGERIFPLHWTGIPLERGAVLGMSFLLGARGLGAFIGPLISAPWAGHSERRLRLGILFGFLAVGIGYTPLGAAGSLWTACLLVMLAHTGGSTVWVFSTTLLQLHTDDKFRGRVFATELGLAMLVLAIGAWVTGILIDRGTAPRSIAVAVGLIMLIPATLWASTLRQSESK